MTDIFDPYKPVVMTQEEIKAEISEIENNFAYIAKHGRPEHYNHVAFGPDKLTCEDVLHKRLAELREVRKNIESAIPAA